MLFCGFYWKSEFSLKTVSFPFINAVLHGTDHISLVDLVSSCFVY